MNLVLGTQSALKRSAVETVIKEFGEKKLLKENVFILPKGIKQLLNVTPLGKQTYQFAKIRAQEMFDSFNSEGDLFAGVENGLIQRFGKTYEECWCVILNTKKKVFTGYSSGVQLPASITNRMKKGELHHEIMLDIAKDQDSRQTWGIYTDGIIVREKSIEEAFRNAFYYAVTDSHV